MKSTGIVRKVDELGRVVIPKETRELLFIEEGDSLEIFKDENEIILNYVKSIFKAINTLECLRCTQSIYCLFFRHIY